VTAVDRGGAGGRGDGSPRAVLGALVAMLAGRTVPFDGEERAALRLLSGVAAAAAGMEKNR
jgi:hypothetical protein